MSEELDEDGKPKKQTAVNLDNDKDCTCPNCTAVFRTKTGEIVKPGIEKKPIDDLPNATIEEPIKESDKPKGYGYWDL